MTQEKDLLLKYLCMALPYKVKTLYVEYEMEIRGIDSVNQTVDVIEWGKHRFSAVPIEEIKPYLRPMSRMTQEEVYEFLSFADTLFRYGKDNDFCCLSLDAILWLLEHHFDFMGLIPKGLAIEVTETNNPYK